MTQKQVQYPILLFLGTASIRCLSITVRIHNVNIIIANTLINVH